MQHDISKFIQLGLQTLSSDEVKIPSSQIEDLAAFKEILKAVLSGQLILATPDRVLPEGAERPNKEPESLKEDGKT